MTDIAPTHTTTTEDHGAALLESAATTEAETRLSGLDAGQLDAWRSVERGLGTIRQTARQAAEKAAELRADEMAWPEGRDRAVAATLADAESKVREAEQTARAGLTILAKSLEGAALPAAPTSDTARALARDEIRLRVEASLSMEAAFGAATAIAGGSDRALAGELLSGWGQALLASRGVGPESLASIRAAAIDGTAKHGTPAQRQAVENLRTVRRFEGGVPTQNVLGARMVLDRARRGR